MAELYPRPGGISELGPVSLILFRLILILSTPVSSDRFSAD